ncbi:MAG: class I SAM-dependent methyltransferase [Bacteroidales bacterium]|nr:class I SAM-dependent methyltransferase [Bacteroidales bacterium]
MDNRYIDREKYFQEQNYTAKKHIIPYINKSLPITSNLVIAEIGCGEGGNLKPFLDIGCKVVGVDIAENKISNAKKFFGNHSQKRNLTLIAEDIYKIKPGEQFMFDLIIMRDTIEHIHDQDTFFEHIKKFIKPSGKLFLAFPPWRMPFGGHQQMCENPFLRKLPYFHLLPDTLYTGILKLFGENKAKINGLLEVKETRISLIKFKNILTKRNFKIDSEAFYMINPNYEIKFKLKTRKLPGMLNIPFIKDFFITTYYCLISLENIKTAPNKQGIGQTKPSNPI